MEPSIYRYILKHSRKDQIGLIILSLLSLPLVYITLELPKQIINLLEGMEVSTVFFGYEFNQLNYLFFLSGAFLLTVLVSGSIKYFLNVYRGALGERLLRRLRYELYERLLRFPVPHFKRVSQGELIPMITAETEPLAEFIGESYTLPVFQGGILFTYVFFIFQQDVFLGLAAISLYPFQLYVIPKLQKRVNQLAKERVAMVRSLSGRIGESVSGIVEVHTNDTSHFERAQIGQRLGFIYKIRYAIYRRKFFIKFLNNFIAQLTPFFFYSVGGYFVLRGDLSIGSMVAVLVAYKDLAGPWKELLNYYQRKEDIKVKYTQVINQFDPPTLIQSEVINARPESTELPGKEIVANNVSYSEDGLNFIVDSASFKLDLEDRIAVVGMANSGKEELLMLVSRLINPTSGQMNVNGQRWSQLPHSISGRRLAFINNNTHLFNGTVQDNLLYPLKHVPVAESTDVDQTERAISLDLSRRAGNSEYQVEDSWVDLADIGINDDQGLRQRIIDVLKMVELDEEIYQFGLLSQVDQSINHVLAGQIMKARNELREKFQEPTVSNLVEPFDDGLYNSNMTVGENLLFGTAYNEDINQNQLADHPIIREALIQADLTNDFLNAGVKIAEVMIDLFSDVESDSELFERFSFIEADDLPEFADLLSRVKTLAYDQLSASDHGRLLSLPLKLIVARHRLGLIDDSIQQKILAARTLIYNASRKDSLGIEFFDQDQYNPRISIQDNILFGKLAYGQANARNKINTLISGVVDTLGLREDIIYSGLSQEVGVGGSRLTSIQRQKLGLARSLLKKPDLLVVHEAIDGLDVASAQRIMRRILDAPETRGVLWALSRVQLAEMFNTVYVLDRGKLKDHGTFDELKMNNAYFQEMLE